MKNEPNEILEAAKVMALAKVTNKRFSEQRLTVSQLEALLLQDSFELLYKKRAKLEKHVHNRCVLVAVVEGAIAGVVSCHWERSFADDVNIAIHPNYRDVGLDRIFMNATDQELNPLLILEPFELPSEPVQ